MRLFSIVVAAPGSAELAGDRCWQAGAHGIWETSTGPGVVVLRVGVDDEHVERFLSALADLDPTDVTETEAVVLAARTVTVGSPDSEVTLRVPPSVFGDGDHPTTAACVSHLVAVVRPGDRLLDVGCGSGVLAVLGARLGARVTAIDVDPLAVETTSENARANGVTLQAAATPLAQVAGVFDVVVANLSAGALVELAAGLRSRTARGGTLILSGILEHRWPDVRAAISGTVVRTDVADGWLTAVLTVEP